VNNELLKTAKIVELVKLVRLVKPVKRVQPVKLVLPMILFLVVVVQGCQLQETGDHPQEAQRQPVALAARHMVAAADPHAVQVGLDILRRGGSAVDAAVAVQMVLTLVEPAESGIGGGGFLLFRHGTTGVLTFYDGREIAPEAANPERFLLPAGIPMPLPAAVVSGRSVGVPGLVAMLHQAHQQHGRLPWPELFAAAINMAEQGIGMPRRLRRQVGEDPSLWLFPDIRRSFISQAKADEPILVNPDLGRSLRRIAQQGPKGFYQGETAEEIVAAVNGRWLWGGDMTVQDLHGYEPEVRHVVCGKYRRWKICSAPPPSAGGIAVLQILAILERFGMPELAPDSPEAVHLFAEACRLAYADSQYYIGDPAFIAVPVGALLNKDYLAGRASLIDNAKTMPAAAPGMVVDEPLRQEAAIAGARASSTTHFSIVDGAGNVAAVTSSLEVPFGSRLLVGGFLLNSQLTDFSFRPHREGRPSANAVAPGKRPRSWMSPTIVLDADGEIRLIIGSRGGASIVAYVAKTIIGVVDWNLPLQEAIALPNIAVQGADLLLEEGTVLADLAGDLRKMGHRVRLRALVSGLHGIEKTGLGWQGGADPRLGGAAAGD
jgi:gamma-glutamyltranspeptidase / glutathione hydrolase